MQKQTYNKENNSNDKRNHFLAIGIKNASNKTNDFLKENKKSHQINNIKLNINLIFQTKLISKIYYQTILVEFRSHNHKSKLDLAYQNNIKLIKTTQLIKINYTQN